MVSREGSESECFLSVFNSGLILNVWKCGEEIEVRLLRGTVISNIR